MNKTRILQVFTPLAALQALTEEAAAAVPAHQLRMGYVAIYAFPFRIGRESRVARDERTGRLIRMERQKAFDVDPDNDLYLLDTGPKLNVSRSHALIEPVDAGYRLVDRHSACGCLINDAHIGGRDRGAEHPLADGDILTLGLPGSPYRFRFIVLGGSA